MGFKIKMAEVSQEELTQIRNDRPSGRYEGPTPPPGVYGAKISRAWFGKTKAGDPVLKVSFVFDNEGENEVYNGAETINNYVIPTDPSSRAFVPQINQLDAFLIALSDGKMGVREFQEAMANGKNDIDQSKQTKIGIPVTQIGSVKITGEKKVNIKTKIREYNGKDYIDLHYILRDEAANSKPKSKPEDDFDDLEDPSDDFEDSTSSSDEGDLDDWLDSDD